MNKSKIKTFAVWARQTLLQHITDRAALLGITAKGITPPDNQTADSITFAGVLYDQKTKAQYLALVKHLEELKKAYPSFQAAYHKLIDEVAYTWFNRLSALRFMELKGYIPRVLSSSEPGATEPDLLRDAIARVSQGELKGLSLDEIDLLRKHHKTPELYNRLLVAQCNALKDTLPALFAHTTEMMALLLPQNLLHQESLVRRMVDEIPEVDWQDVEIVGWLYQYYISERKDQVIGKTVATADIPAATQLFTPHWIVKYMVQNSLGKLWMEAHPESKLQEQMEFYLPTPTQTPEVQAKIEATINPQLSPEELTVIDPACGSGHILTYAFELLFEIYKERGYSEREIPEKILRHNLFGLDIDERAAQLATFALLMKAREKSRRILREGQIPALNLLAIEQTRGLADELKEAAPALLADWHELIKAFEDADTLGSLITPPAVDLAQLQTQLEQLENKKDFFVDALLPRLKKLLQAAQMLSQQYNVVVANPPYMGSKNMNKLLGQFLKENYNSYKDDLFSSAIYRYKAICAPNGHLGFLTPVSLMFLDSYKSLRHDIIFTSNITTLIQLEHNSFESAGIPVCTFTLRNTQTEEIGVYFKLSDFPGSEIQPQKVLESILDKSKYWRYELSSKEFIGIPSYAIAFWTGKYIRQAFKNGIPLEKIVKPKQGLSTSNNDRFIRLWFEANLNSIGFNIKNGENAKKSQKRWFPYNKGGTFRKWYGNNEYVVNWFNNAIEMRLFHSELNKNSSGGRIKNQEFYFLPSLTWTFISLFFGVRRTFGGFIFDVAGSSVFPIQEDISWLTSFLCSKPAFALISSLNPTMNFQVKDVGNIPLLNIQNVKEKCSQISENCVLISAKDWDNFETSWDFQTHPLTRYDTSSLSDAFSQWLRESETNFRELQRLEEENNRYWIEAYGLQDELTPEVPDEQITIRRADLGRDIRSFLSYAVGNMLGRYSLDEPGLIHAGQPFEAQRHQTFPAEPEGFVPINDQGYFANDLATRFVDFVKACFGAAQLQANLDFIAEALECKKNETAEERIRRYFLTEFVKDHNQTYKKRPIYWLFTSGKKRAFNAFVYLHRYTPDTLSKLRIDYLHELQFKLDAQLEHAKDIAEKATSATDKKKASQRAKELTDQIAELKGYDEKLRHLADQRITLDLDDGVAYNYTLFEGLVYEGADLKMADLKAKSEWKRELLAQAAKGSVATYNEPGQLALNIDLEESLEEAEEYA